MNSRCNDDDGNNDNDGNNGDDNGRNIRSIKRKKPEKFSSIN